MTEYRNFGEYDPEDAVDFVAGWEGFREKAYVPVAGDVWTIGYGHTHGVQEGDTITQSAAKRLLRNDLQAFKQALLPFVNKPVGANMFVALLSLAFNVGSGSVIKSRLMRNLNLGHYDEAAWEFLNGWNTVGGKVVQGLVRRRAAEFELFCKDLDDDPTA